MVRLSKIYTRTGDDGTTGLGDGERVAKTDVRVEAYGTVDEANAAIGLAIVQAHSGAAATAVGHSGGEAPGAGQAGEQEPGGADGSRGESAERWAEVAALLKSIQHDLFDVGADLCCPIGADEAPGTRLRVSAAQTKRLEDAIDRHNERLRPLNSFVLPGGTALAASLHLARTITRRAERATVLLHDHRPTTTNPETVRYLNRLSDLLFVLGRVANRDGADDVLWIPGANR